VAGTATGRLYAGTSGFAYPGWAPAFYPPGLRNGDLLRHYASRLDACELNATYYRRPSPSTVRRWADTVPDGFRFVIKAQRGAAYRAITGDAASAVAWLTEPLHPMGERLGAVLLRVEPSIARDDSRLDALLKAWPADVRLCVELQHPAWTDDAVHARLRAAGAALCATDVDDDPEPDLRVSGELVYVRLRRSSYDGASIERWARRFAPFLAAGHDVFAFFRHDEHGRSALNAEALRAAVTRVASAANDRAYVDRDPSTALPSSKP
jgi:uncharacterized protein YecE (DUF72 family)